MSTGLQTTKDVIFWWQQAMLRFNLELKPQVQFLDIQVKNKNIYTGIGVETDWWPKDQIIYRTKLIEDYGAYAPSYWTTYKGTRQTAEYLWETKDSLEKWGAIFIQAFIKNRIDSLPEHWRGQGYALLNSLSNMFYKEDLTFSWFHSCRNQLPLSLLNLYEINKTIKPTNIHMLIDLAAVDTVLCLSTWQLVRVIGFDKEQ